MVQPRREVLLQICCRCSHRQQLVQFMIAGLRVWFEAHDSVEAAIRREKQIKEWKREWKFNLIERDNPHWVDLFSDVAP